MDTISVLSIIIAVLGCLVGVSGWVRRTKIDSNEQKAAQSEVKTTIDFMSDDVKEIKMTVRHFSNDLQEIRAIAMSAKTEAKRANDRIDSLIDDGKQ